MNEEYFVKGDFGIKKEKFKSMFQIKFSKKDFKETYTLRARIGIYIGVLIGLIDLNLTK